MTLKNAINHFNQLIPETTKKSEIRIYRDFIHILTSLEKRNLPEPEVQSIERALDALDLNSNVRSKKRHYSKALHQFKIFLKNTFSFITKGYYTELAVTFGASAGLLLGILFLSDLDRSLGISLGIIAGTVIGLLAAKYLDEQAKASGNFI